MAMNENVEGHAMLCFHYMDSAFFGRSPHTGLQPYKLMVKPEYRGMLPLQTVTFSGHALQQQLQY
jgi:hypothetical protein